MRCRHTYCSSHEEIWEDFRFDLELTRLASFRQPVSIFLFAMDLAATNVLTRWQDFLSSCTNPQVSRQPRDEAVWLVGCQQVSLSIWYFFKAPSETFSRTACNLDSCRDVPAIDLWIGPTSYRCLWRSSFTEGKESRGGSQAS